MSEEQYHSASHCKYLTQYHILWCPEFRFSALQKGADDKLKNILADICNQYGYEIKALEVMPDHIHIFVDCPQTVAPCDIVRTLKSISAIEMFKFFPKVKQFYSPWGILWLRGRFVSTVGHISGATIKKYIGGDRKIMTEEYRKVLKQFHKLSDRHILVAETDMPYSDVVKVVTLSDKIRKAGNELVGLMRKNYDQLLRTKRYRRLLKLYGNARDKDKHRVLAKQLNEMQSEYNVTWDFCRKSMIPIGKKYGIDAVFALTKAEDVWRGIEKCLYGNGKTIHFSKYGELPCIRAKQINRGIPISVKDDKLQFKLGKMIFWSSGKR